MLMEPRKSHDGPLANGDPGVPVTLLGPNLKALEPGRSTVVV